MNKEIIDFLNRRFPKVEQRLIDALNHQEEYNPLLTVDHGISLYDYVRD